MKKNNKKNQQGKIMKAITPILVPILIIVFVACTVISVFQGILDIVKNVINNILDVVLHPINFIKSTAKKVSNWASRTFDWGHYSPPSSGDTITIFIDSSTVEEISKQISESVDQEATGFTDEILTKMLLASYTATSTKDTLIGLEIDEAIFNSKVPFFEKGDHIYNPDHPVLQKGVDELDPYEADDGYYYFATTEQLGESFRDGVEIHYFMGKYGNIELYNLSGEKMVAYTDEHWQKLKDDYESGKDDYKKAILDDADAFYTVSSPGEITVISSNNVNTKYKYTYNFEGYDYVVTNTSDTSSINDRVIDYRESISGYVMSTNFLVDLLNVSASADFIEAVCDLVHEDTIKIQLADNSTETKETTTFTYNQDISMCLQKVNPFYETTTENKDNKENEAYNALFNNANNQENIEMENILNKNISNYTKMENIIKATGTVTSEKVVSTKDQNFGFVVTEADTWVKKEKRNYTKSSSTTYKTIDNDGNEVVCGGEDEAIEKSVSNSNKNRNTKVSELSKDNLTFDSFHSPSYTGKNINMDNLMVISRADCVGFQKEEYSENLSSDLGLCRKIANYGTLETKFYLDDDDTTGTIEELNEITYGITKDWTLSKEDVTVNQYNEKQKYMLIVTENTVNEGVSTVTDNTDEFLGLLKNSSGEYEEGAMFNSNGKMVKYKDLYGDEDSVPALLLENGDQELFELLESADDTKDLVEVMKYILYRLTGNDYGVTTLDFTSDSSYSSVENGTISYESLSLTQTDKELLYQVTYAERGDGSQKQQEYVASVILNRVLSKDYPNTVLGVVSQSGQFLSYPGCLKKIPTNTTKKAVDNVIETGDKSKAAIGFMTPEAYYRQGWLQIAIKAGTYKYLFNDEDEIYNNPNDNVTHNFFTKASVLKDLKQYKKNTTGNGDVIETCKEITNLYLGRNGHYGPQTYNNIKKTYESDTNLVCATYVSVVLYKSGLLTESQINGYNYHYTGAGGIPDMLKAAGWKQVPLSESQPGDVWNRPSQTAYGGGHAMIYAGNGKVWDQSSCMISSDGSSPSRGMRNYSNTQGVVCWRAPNS